MKTSLFFQLGWFIAFSAAYPQQEHPGFSVGGKVDTSSGAVAGKAASERKAVSEYLGIPFAQPPVGALRFAAPQAYVGSGVLNATSFVSRSP